MRARSAQCASVASCFLVRRFVSRTATSKGTSTESEASTGPRQTSHSGKSSHTAPETIRDLARDRASGGERGCERERFFAQLRQRRLVETGTARDRFGLLLVDVVMAAESDLVREAVGDG